MHPIENAGPSGPSNKIQIFISSWIMKTGREKEGNNCYFFIFALVKVLPSCFAMPVSGNALQNRC